MFKNDPIAQIKQLATLSEFIGEYIEVKKMGKNATCCCPFHDDRSPSMSISDDRGFYHCFGCGASGDIFTFAQEYLGLSFKDALKELASKYNVPLNVQFKAPLENNVLMLLQERFVIELSKNASALRYLRERGLSDASIAAFGLGYAPSNAATIKLLEANEIPPQMALEQGAIKHNENGLYASFIERITYPIYDASGALIGFGARTLNPNNPAKYVNSPTCKLFDKKQIFYGYFAAKSAIRQRKMMLVCEGYMDVIAFHQCGITYAVAALGVAMGSEHLRLVSKDIFIRLCFDSDAAGQNAAFKAASLLALHGYNGDVINLSPYKDAGEFIQKGAGDKLAQAANIAGINIISFVIDYIFKSNLNIKEVKDHSFCDPYLIRAALKEVLGFLEHIDGFLAKKHLELFSQRAQISLNELDLAKDLAPKAPTNFIAPINESKINDEFAWPKQISDLERSTLNFVLANRANFKEVLVPKYFKASGVANLLANLRFDDPALIEFKEHSLNASRLNIVEFLINCAQIYSFNIKDARAQLLAQFINILSHKQSDILRDGALLKRAYLALASIISFEYKDALSMDKICQEINYLGDI